jgi:hypothetical protein
VQFGFDNVKTLGEKMSIQDHQFVTRSLLRTDGPPHGWIADMVQPAVDDALLKCVPAEAMAVVSIRVDPAKAYDTFKAAAGVVGGSEISREFADFEKRSKETGVPLQEVLKPLGDQWVLYDSNVTGGMFVTGWTLVGTLKDAEGFNRQAARLSTLFLENGGPRGRRRPGFGSPRTREQYVVDGQTIHYLAPQEGRGLPFGMPAWAQVGDKVVVALYPQIVESAVRRMSAEQSLLDDPGFQAARKLAGNDGPMLFFSGQQAVKEIYPAFMILQSLGWSPRFVPNVGYGANGDGEAGAPDLIPPMDRLLQYVGDDMATVKVTPDGVLRTKCIANPLLSLFTLADNLPMTTTLLFPWLHNH